MSHAVVCELYDLESNLLADISEIALERTLKRRASQAREFVITAPAGHSLLTTVAGDGYMNLRKGNRKLVVTEDTDVVFHGRVQTVERNGDGTRNLVTITAAQPLAELGYGEKAGRPVRDETGNFISPEFTSSEVGQDEVSGPDLIFQALTNSQVGPAAETPGPGGEGELPIDIDIADFDTEVPPAVDLTPSQSAVWPILIGDFIQLLVATGVVDVDEIPLDPGAGTTDYKMVSLTARSALGTDRSATVHFDYWTGSKNASACRHVEDFGAINNKLYDYLGPPDAGGNRFPAGNITPTLATGALATAITASRDLYGIFMQIRIVDTFGVDTDARPLYFAAWAAEQGYRVEPRDLLFITPSPDTAALFEAPADFDVFDLIEINTGAAFGVTLAAAQRVYGYDRTWDRNGVARLSQLITSADIAS